MNPVEMVDRHRKYPTIAIGRKITGSVENIGTKYPLQQERDREVERNMNQVDVQELEKDWFKQ